MIAVCGIGSPQRVPEQRGDGEPVGERADHRGLGGGADVAHPRAGARSPAARRPGRRRRRPGTGRSPAASCGEVAGALRVVERTRQGSGRSGCRHPTSLEKGPAPHAASSRRGPGRGSRRSAGRAQRDLGRCVVRCPRRTVSVTSSPGASLRTAAVSSVEVVTGRSPTAVIDVARPAARRSAAALSGSTWTIWRRCRRSEFWLSAAVRALTPRKARVALPVSMISLAIRWAVLRRDREARRRCCRSAPASPGRPEATVAIAVLMPITSPAPLTRAPPELPGLIAASVWMRVDHRGVVLRRAGLRPRGRWR